MKQRLLSFILAAVLVLTPSLTVLAEYQAEAVSMDDVGLELLEEPETSVEGTSKEELMEESKGSEELLEEPEGSMEGNAKKEENIEPAAASASEVTSGDFAYTVSAGEATITRYVGSATAVTVPAQLDGINVVYIANGAFEENTTIESVVFSDGIKELGSSVFYGCTALKSVTFSNTLESLGRWGFEDTSIESLTFDQDSELVLDYYAFAGADHLKSVAILGELTSLEGGTFSECKALETVTFGSRVMELYDGDAGLSECPNLKTISVSVSNPYFTVKENVLYNEDMTKLLCYPASMEKTEYIMPDSVTEIPAYTFQYNQYLQKIVCGKGLTKIGRYVGIDNYCISIVEIPSNVTEIGQNCFDGATIWSTKDNVSYNYAKKYGLGFVDVDSLDGLDGKESTPGSDCSEWNGSSVEAITPIGNTYVVTTAGQLAWLAQQTASGNSFSGKKILLDADIDLAGMEWTPIGNSNTHFQGSFDGQDHYIHNLKVTGSGSKSLCGLFGGVGAPTAGINTVIKNIHLTNVEVTNASYGGGLAGYARIYKGTNLIIENCTVEGTVSGNIVGGVIGRIAGGLSASSVTIQAIESICSVTADSTGGGLIGIIEQYGYNYSVLGNGVGTVSIIDCSNDGHIQGTGTYSTVSGLIGEASNTARGILTIEHCMTEGSVDCSSSVYVGGIISQLSGKQNTIKQCVNYTNITGGYYAGGIVGEISSNALVEQCYNEGNISVKRTGCYLGGIAGRNASKIKDCYNTGSMGGGDVVYNGGIVGYNAGYLENCYNIGTLPNRGMGADYVSLPGAMAPLIGGYASYCFFDKTQDEDGYLFGRMDTQDIITDAELNIKYSGGMTTAEMKTPAAFIVWDFENVWEINREYGYGYPILKEVKDILKKHPDESKTSMEQEPDEYRITVVDQNGEAIPEVIVKCGNATMETNEDGVAIFLYKEGRTSISVSNEGYISYVDDDYRMNPTLENTIRLISEDVKDEYALNSAVLWWHGNRYELLTQTKEINRKYQDEVANVFCTTIADLSQVDKVELYQGNKLIDESPDGYFSLMATDFIETKVSGKVRQTHVKVYLKDGTVQNENINLNVVDEDNKVSEIEFGNNIKFVAGNDVPLIGGTEISFDTMQLPINFTVSEEKWKVSMNIMEKEMGEAAEFFKSELTATKKLEKLKQYMEKGTVTPAKNPKITLEIVGYGEGDLPVASNKVKMTAYVRLSLKTSNEVQVVPAVVFAVEFNGYVQADGSLIWDPVELKMDGNLKLSAKAALSAFLGLGIANVASAGAYGTGSLDIVFYLLPASKTGLDQMYMSADMKAVIRFFGSNAVEARIAGPWYGWIYSRELEEYSLNSLSDTPETATMDSFLSELNVAAATASPQAASTFDGTGEILVEHAYSESAPVLMESQGDVIMLFTDNGVENRKAEDASVLMYSVYDDAAGTWGTHSPVWEDGTADFKPVAAGDYVAWNNSKGTLAGCETYVNLGEAQEVAVAKYNSATKSFEEAKNITDNDVFENNVSIQNTSDGPVLAWVVNSAGNVFGVEGSNDIYMAASGDWAAEKVAVVDGVVLKVQPGYYNGNASCVYVVDENDNLIDSAGQVAYVVDMDSKEAIKVSDMDVTYAWITETAEQIMYVGMDGQIYSCKNNGEDGTNGSEPELGEDIIDGVVDVMGTSDEEQDGLLLGSVTDVLEDENGNITVFYVVNEDNCSNAYRIFYDAMSDKWSEPVAVTEQTDYVEQMSGIYIEDTLIYAYNQRAFDMESEDLNGINSIRWGSMEKDSAVFTELDVHFNIWDVASGAELPMTVSVKNTGTAASHGVQLLIKDGDTVYVDELIDETVLPGEEKEISLDFALPDKVEKTEYTLELTPTSGNTQDMVSTTFTVGESYYQIEKNSYCIGGKHMIVATIQNLGFEAGSGTLEIFDNTGSGKVYETFDFEGLEYGKVLYYSTYIENLDWDSFEITAIGLRVMKDGKEAGDMRSVTIFQELEDITVSSVAVSQTYAALDGIGYEVQMEAKVMPEACQDIPLKWVSSDTSVAIVDENGLVTAVGQGQAYIMVSTEDGSYFGRCAVEVGTSVNPENPNPDKPTPTPSVTPMPTATPTPAPTPGSGEDKNVFEDVEKGKFYYNPVLWAVDNGITAGVTPTRFMPLAECTRAQIVAFIWRAQGKPEAQNTTCTFTDVSEKDYFYKAMLWAVENKITSGYTEQIFAPDATCTRAEIVTFLWRVAGRPAPASQAHTFTDVRDSAFYYKAMLWAVENKITSGYTPTAFAPEVVVTRGETVTFLYRAYK